MNITVQIDEVNLNTIVGDIVSFDEDGDPVVEGQTRVADMVADRIAARVAGSPEFRELTKRVTAIRDEMIREKLTPVLAEVMEAPIRKTNSFGEQTGEPVTMRELVMESARELLSQRNRQGYNQAPWITNFIHEQVRELFEKELKAELAKAREKLVADIAMHYSMHGRAIAEGALKQVEG